jgi:DNA sulfur modification protein DndE
MSLADQSPPLVREVQTNSNVEMSWRTFAGSAGNEYTSLLEERMTSTNEGFPDIYALFLAHLHRGIGQLAGTLDNRSGIDGLIDLAMRTEH